MLILIKLSIIIAPSETKTETAETKEIAKEQTTNCYPQQVRVTR